jgi:hypothetical protein
MTVERADRDGEVRRALRNRKQQRRDCGCRGVDEQRAIDTGTRGTSKRSFGSGNPLVEAAFI